MTKKLLFVVSILLVAALGAMAADVSGKYTFDQPGRGGNTTTVTMTLKADGSKLTGTLSQPGRDGNAMETAISDGKIDGNNISFKVVREFNGMSISTEYSGVAKGDTIDLTIKRPGRGGAEPPPPVTVTAKKVSS